MNEETLFERAAQLRVAERAAWLEEQCAGQPELRARVEALLAADEASRVPLDQPLVVADATRDYTPVSSDNSGSAPNARTRRDDQVGTVIGGKYTVVELIGEGGMGSVWRARQTEPMTRFVAVKLIKAGMDSRQVLARFEAERQALALMDHPNIAKVLDGGLHDQRPFFVMELVKGAPITEYCDQHRLTPRQRLELFVQACHAIQHAHQKGIIHRDIKPSNVLVALYDDRPVVKVIDFGVAKATGGTLTEATIDTGFGGVVGTPQYMSPEQATFNNLDIDTRSDVYALGVLLYELLVGSPPFSGEELKKKGFIEILRVVREEDPPRPSTKLSTADALPSLSASRGTEPKQLTGLLRNELDWIVMKALEKDRSRRYETANGFAADVQRFLAGEAVTAHPPSAAYRVRKFVRRHRPQVIAAGLLVSALALGIVGTAWGLFQAKRHERVAVEAANGERRAREREAARAESEKLAKEQTQKRLAQIEKGVSLFGQMLQGINPKLEQQGGESLYELLLRRAEQAANELDSESVGDPLVVARLQTILGDTIYELGNPSKAAEVLEKACAIYERNSDAKDSEKYDALCILGGVYMSIGRPKEAVDLLERGRDYYVQELGPDHRVTLSRLSDLAAAYEAARRTPEAIALLEDVLDRRAKQLGAGHPDVTLLQHNLAMMYNSAGRNAEAIAAYEYVCEAWQKTLGPDHIRTLTARMNMSSALFAANRYGEVIAILEPLNQQLAQKLGPEHHLTAAVRHNLATAYRITGRRGETLVLWEQAYAARAKTLGVDHHETIASLNELANAYQEAGKIQEAIPLLVRILDWKIKTLGVDHPRTFNTLMNLGNAYRATGKLDDAIAQFEIILGSQREKLESDDSRILDTMSEIAGCHWLAGRFDKSIPAFQEVVARSEKQLGRDARRTLHAITNLGINYKDAGQLSEAIPLLEEATRQTKQHPELRFANSSLLEAYSRTGNQEAVARLGQEMLSAARAEFPAGGMKLTSQLIPVGRCFVELRQFAEAEPLLRECLSIFAANNFNRWNVHYVESDLGAALAGQGKHADAEALLLQAYAGLKAKEMDIPPLSRGCLMDTLDRLVTLYEATNKPEEAAKYQELRAKLARPGAPSAAPEAKP